MQDIFQCWSSATREAEKINGKYTCMTLPPPYPIWMFQSNNVRNYLLIQQWQWCPLKNTMVSRSPIFSRYRYGLIIMIILWKIIYGSLLRSISTMPHRIRETYAPWSRNNLKPSNMPLGIQFRKKYITIKLYKGYRCSSFPSIRSTRHCFNKVSWYIQTMSLLV